MALIAVNARNGQIEDRAGRFAALEARLAGLRDDETPVVMIHGYSFSPNVAGQSPHDHILSFTPDPGCWKAVSWPRLLGFSPGGPGLAIAFGWEARGSLWSAYAEAARAGATLAGLLDRIATLSPGRTVGIIAHSLGARVALQALARRRRPGPARLILLTPAEFRRPAAAAFAQSPGVQVLSVSARANLAFDTMMRLSRPRAGTTLGGGLPEAGPRWLDLALDRPETLDALARLGQDIARPGPRICHWNVYLRPGVFGLYRDLLRGGVRLSALRHALPGPAPARPRLLPPLPGARNAPS